MNIESSSQFRGCTSCQMCAAVCPTSAIGISLDNEGFYRPHVNPHECVDCGACVGVCYKFDREVGMKTDFASKRLYSAQTGDERLSEVTTSGGVADILARHLIACGYECVGVIYDDRNNRAEGRIAVTEEETRPFRGSKYIQAYTAEAFRKLVSGVRERRFAVFGLPCHIYAIDRLLRKRRCREHHLLIDLYCHGCPSMNLWTRYSEEILKRTGGDRILGVNFRSKVRGWGNFNIVARVDKGGESVEVVSPRTRDAFYTLFFSDLILNSSCSDCLLRSTLEYCDIRLGDFWGKKFAKDHKGVSAVTVCSEEGEKALTQLEDDLHLKKENWETFLPWQSYGKNYHVDEDLRRRLLGQLEDQEIPLKTIVDTYIASMSPTSRLKFELKQIVKLLPQSVISFLRTLR